MENIDDAVWAPLFKNLNDGSNEGIIHKTLPIMSAQFHPEARGGPNDTFFMFDQFVTQCRQQRLGRPVANFFKYKIAHSSLPPCRSSGCPGWPG